MVESDRLYVVVLLVLGLVTRFACLNYPREVVWDEFHFGEPPPASSSAPAHR